MTEREKLLSGLEYNSRDEELIAMYHRARALTKSLGALDSHQADEKTACSANCSVPGGGELDRNAVLVRLWAACPHR